MHFCDFGNFQFLNLQIDDKTKIDTMAKITPQNMHNFKTPKAKKLQKPHNNFECITLKQYCKKSKIAKTA